MKPIVFVCGHRKAGTTMFHNLFDGHSDLSVYPVDLNILYGYYPQYTDGVKSSDELKNRLDNVVFKDLAKLELLRGSIDISQFRDKFFCLCKA